MADPTQAPFRQKIITFTTPRVADIMVSEMRTTTRESVPEYGTPHPDKKLYPHHILSYVSPADESGLWRSYVYVAKREKQDLYNWSYSVADIGGTKFDAVVRVYVTLRSEFPPNTPAMGAKMPNVPVDLFGTGTGTPSVVAGYVLAERKQEKIQDKELDSLFVIDQQVFVKRSTITELGVDSLNGKILASQTDLYYATEVVTGGLTAAQLFADPTNAYWGLQADGTQRSGKQLSTEWYMIETSQVVSGVFTDGVVLINSFSTNDHYDWPPVLNTVEFMDWVRRDGGVDIFPRIVYAKEGYSGPCKTTVTTSWSKTAFTIPKADQMLPVRMSYSSPFFSVNVPPCLHGEVTFVCDIGSSDPVYAENSGSSRTFSATGPTDNTWPATITAYDDQQPFRGGFLRTTKVIHRPSA
jgi:hypothetical protein